MHASPARALGLVPVTAISAAVLPVIAQGFNAGLTAAQCDSVVANAIANPTNADTLRLVRFCPDAFGPTIADLLTDRTDLLSGNQATYFLIVDLAMKYIEDDVWDAARGLAVDGSAPELARTGAMLILLAMSQPGGTELSLQQFVGWAGPSTNCTASAPTTSLIEMGEEPVTGDWITSVLSVVEAVRSSSAPASTKFVATCIKLALQPLDGRIPGDPVSFVPATHFSYVKQCGRRFLLRNSSTAWVTLEIYLSSSSPPYGNVYRRWSMPPRPEGASYSENTWTAPRAGTAWVKSYLPNPVTLMQPTSVDTTPC